MPFSSGRFSDNGILWEMNALQSLNALGSHLRVSIKEEKAASFLSEHLSIFLQLENTCYIMGSRRLPQVLEELNDL